MSDYKIKIKIKPGELSKRFERDIKSCKKGAIKGLRVAAEKGLELLKERTPEDEGTMKAAWRIDGSGMKLMIKNDAPYADIVNSGARQHGVSEEGQQLILDWIHRHDPSLTDAQANNMLWGIMIKLKSQGYEGHHMVEATADQREELLYNCIGEYIAKELDSN